MIQIAILLLHIYICRKCNSCAGFLLSFLRSLHYLVHLLNPRLVPVDSFTAWSSMVAAKCFAKIYHIHVPSISWQVYIGTFVLLLMYHRSHIGQMCRCCYTVGMVTFMVPNDWMQFYTKIIKDPHCLQSSTTPSWCYLSLSLTQGIPVVMTGWSFVWQLTATAIKIVYDGCEAINSWAIIILHVVNSAKIAWQPWPTVIARRIDRTRVLHRYTEKYRKHDFR